MEIRIGRHAVRSLAGWAGALVAAAWCVAAGPTPRARAHQAPAVAAAPLASDAAEPTPRALSITSSGAIPEIRPGHAAFAFGSVALLDRTSVEHVFTVRNTSSQPLTISRVRSTCGCVSAVVSRTENRGTGPAPAGGAAPPLPLTLEPGAEIGLSVRVDLATLPPGRVRKTVSVYLAGAETAAATAEVLGILLPTVTIDPGIANLDRTTPGDGRELTLKVTFDPRLLAAVPDPQLSSTNPALIVSDGPAPEKTSTDPASASGAVRYYRVALAPDAPLGPLYGSLEFVPPPDASVPVTAALKSGKVPLSGHVVGDISSTPQTVAMGIVPRGQSATATVALTGKTAADIAELRIESPHPWLTAEVTPVQASSAAPTNGGIEASTTRGLRVTIAPDAPPGSIWAQLFVVTKSGRRLLVPVSAFVQGG